ncbi:hypothetical protein [Ensifer canadensis]
MTDNNTTDPVQNIGNFVNVLNGLKLDDRTSRAVSIFTNLKESAVEIIKFMREVKSDETMPIDLRRRAAEFILEAAPVPEAN